MKYTEVFALLMMSTLFGAPAARAEIARSAISSAKITIYGIYTTADATCQTGWIKSFLNASPTVADMTTSPTLGSGPVASPINCALFIAKNSMLTSVAAGNYGATSSNGGADSACDAGVTDQEQRICRSTTPDWPTLVKTDAAAAGLTLVTACPSSPLGTEIIPIYMSVNSSCTGQALLDGSNAHCQNGGGSGPAGFNMPEAASTLASSANGIKLTSIASSGGTVYFAVDSDKTMGNGGSNQCTNTSPGRMYVHQ